MEFKDFTLGVNYWPINKAMYWWRDFSPLEVEIDFARLKEFKIKYVRIFLIWEDFQPQPHIISDEMLSHLVNVADIAGKYGLKLMPTFFCGHMSGANWMPNWMLDSSSPNNDVSRFPIYSNHKVRTGQIKNFYKLDELLAAQVLQITKVCQSLKGHQAIYGYDLGNESSNCYIPSSRAEGQTWLRLLTNAVKENSQLPVTYGIHAEDLEENRHIWPQDVGEYCDFVVMHGYPFYFDWTLDPLDVSVLPFLGIITKWLADKPVLFQEFGAASIPSIPPYLSDEDKARLKCPLWTEVEIKNYYQEAVQSLHEAGMIGAWAWCYGDYSPDLWGRTPFKENYHERYFGLFRHDGSPKLSANVLQNADNLDLIPSNPEIPEWLKGFKRDEFYLEPLANLIELYKRYKTFIQNKEKS